MDGGGSMQSNEERGAEKLMDEHLKSIGLHRKKIAKDGSCLFRAVAEQVLHCQSLHTEVRAKCVEFLKQNRGIYEAFIEGDFEDYLYKLQDPQQWVGEVEINALAVMYKRDFLIFQEPGKPAVNITANNFNDKVQLCFLNGNHYDSVYPISYIKNAALCQSILYELLYDGVFKVDRSSLSVCQRTPRSNDLLSDDNMPACCSSDESDLDAGEPLWIENGASTATTRHHRGRGRGRHMSDRVRRSLNPTLFRNIEYDVWHKTKRAQQKMDYCIAAGMQFTVGDRCQVRIEGRNYSATIKEVPPNNGPVTVYIDELGRRQVALWNLRPYNDENSWSTVVNRDKRISNGHGEWEEKGKGRGRGKHVPASSSVSQATAPGPSGRVQKQHSWPPQATVEEQGGAKPNRSLKSVSSVEAAFGLTEKQRLAKEEEERNVALVEIQLRDEHSFPALGAQPGMQGDAGRKKGGEKKRSQRNKTKSPVEDVRVPSPSAGERPKSSTPPLAATAAATTAPTTSTTTPSDPTPPAAKPPAAAAAPSANSDSSLAWPSSLKAPSPDINMAAATAAAIAAPSISTSTCAAPTAKSSAPSYALAAGATSSSPAAAPSANSDSSPAWLSSLKAPSPDVNMATGTAATGAASISTSTCAAPTTKSNAPSYALAAGAPLSSPPPPAAAVAPSTKPSVMGGAVPPSVPSSASHFSFLPPVLPVASSPPTPHVLSSSSPPPSSSSKPLTSSSLPPQSSASPPPSSSLPPPTFIAPIAPSPAAAQGFLPRSSPPLSSLPPSTSPPSLSSSSVQNSSSSSLIRHAAQAHEAPPVSAQTPNSLPNIGGTLTASHTLHNPASLSHIHPQVSQSHVSVAQTQTQVSLTQSEDHSQTSLPTNQIMMLQMQTEAQSSVPQSSVPQSSVPQSCLPHLQHHHPQSHTEVTSLPQTHIQPSVSQPQSQAQFLSQSQSEVIQVQSSQPHTSQASLPVSVHPHPSVTHPHLHVHPGQPPHPSQVPHPSLSLSASPTHPSLQPQTPDTQNPTEAPPPSTQHAPPQPDSPPQQSHPPHPSHHPPPPPQPQSIPGAVPLQQLSQLYHDLLYPGFPQGDKGDVAPTPHMSSSKSGDDLPRDVNILRFFFNLGVKAYSMPYFPPYIYLLPLQQAHTMHPKLPSRSPSPTPTPTPHYPPSNPPARPQETYSHPQYPPTSASMPPQYDHQAPLAEHPHPSEPSFSQAGYPVTQPPPHRVSWQEPQMPPPRNPSFPVGYPTQSPAYPPPPTLSQGYHAGQGPGHPLYPPSVSPYPPSSLAYQSSSAHEEHQVGQGVMEQRQPTNGDTLRGQGPSRVPGPAAANLANANNNRTVAVPGFALKTEQGDSLPGAVLLLDPPLNNDPILVSNPGVKDAPVSMTTMKTSSLPPYDIISKTTVPGDNNPSSRGFRGHQKPIHTINKYVPVVAPEPGQVSYLPNVAMGEPLSVGCSTENDWEEQIGYKPQTLNHRGSRRGRGGGGGRPWRGGHEPGRGSARRRHGGEAGVGLGYIQYNSSHKGRGRERGGY